MFHGDSASKAGQVYKEEGPIVEEGTAAVAKLCIQASLANTGEE